MSYKKFNEQDFSTNEFFINEGIRLYYRQFSGSAGEANIKLPDHYPTNGRSGSFYLDVYDKPHQDISSNRLVSFSYGFTTSSSYCSGAFSGSNQAPKLTMYRLFAKRLLGGESNKFSIDGKVLNEAIFLSVARNQYKDFIMPKGTLMWYYLTGSPGREPQTGSFSYGFLTDYQSKIQSEFAGPTTYLYDYQSGKNRGIIFSKAGIVVLDPDLIPQTFNWSGSMSYENLAKGLSGTTHNDLLWSIKNRIWFWDFSGSQKTVSSFYNCTANPDEFNYSSNPSFRSESGEIFTSISSSNANTYITQILLLGQNNEVLAVAKTRSPVRKNPDTGVKIVARLDT
jgi:hypothetical protein